MYDRQKKIMSGGLYAEPGIIKQGHHDQDDKEENIVDIYVSAESLRVYDNPWVENMARNIPAETQHSGIEQIYSIIVSEKVFKLLVFHDFI